ncbi:hypothetical protein M9H77_12331 [Catharanthus roseus]|uniref:Uncharacterized protein n=1 Tax=Catharanthus roseus TaxID=4058 RepID=A0ACC0BHA3_CATRO|nr:hypothetical protein M9H77_12331 [Catharanthus roseus]
MKVNTYLIVTRYLISRTSDRRPYVTLGCNRGGVNKPRTKPVIDDEEEIQVKRWDPYGTKKCGYPFKLKGKQMAIVKIGKYSYTMGGTTMQQKNVIGDGNCGYRVVADFVFSDEHQWPELQINDECPIPPLHVQWIHYRSKRVSNWADSYYERIAD